MRWSKHHIPTLRESPSDAEVVSHQLMLRAGMIRKLASGVYSFLPLGWKVIRRMENIIREEMDRSGALEVSLPIVQPRSLWDESGRWELYGKSLARFTDRHENEFCLQPTSEEVIVDLARRDLKSYKQLPIHLYQIQTKFRDEIRPRFGVMRSREFIMKDAYSFDLTEEAALQSYEEMRGVYRRIFMRTGLKFRPVEADTGEIGGLASEEFVVLAESGEDEIVSSESGTYAANQEKAQAFYDHPQLDLPPAVENFKTPGAKTIDDLHQQFGVKTADSIKTMIGTDGAGKKIIVLLLRGDHELNEVKVGTHLSKEYKIKGFRLAREDELEKWELPKGSLGPVDFPKPHILVADNALSPYAPYVCGANKEGVHLKNVCLRRDAKVKSFVTIHNVLPNELAPDGSGPLRTDRGIEVGHVFYLGTKYSKAMKLEVNAESGGLLPLQMGCYGIGVARTVAACIEQNHDQWGIIWPLSLSPYEVSVISLGEGRAKEEAQKIYEGLLQKGYDVIFDDRDLSPGVKLKDSDLVGLPYQVIVGDRGLANEEVEFKIRRENQKTRVALSSIVDHVVSQLENEKDRLRRELAA